MNKADVQTCIDSIRTNESSFYRSHWGEQTAFASLPPLSRKKFFDTPLSTRRYKNAAGLLKIVSAPEGQTLSEWQFEDIEAEEFGPIGMRPLVAFSAPHETVEKGLWCYGRNALPLVAEQDLELMWHVAQECNVDSVLCDIARYHELVPFLSKKELSISTIAVVDSAFANNELCAGEHGGASLHLTLALPETGAFASAECTKNPVFTAHANCIVEAGERTLLTKVRSLVTPIVRYDAGIALIDNGNGTFKLSS